jgi:uncharacterized membrane protein (UPF0127 family)
MKWAERIVMVLLVVVFVGGAAWGYFAVVHERAEVREAVSRGEFQIPDKEVQEPDASEQATDWQAIYPNTIQLTIADISVQASVADTLTKRIKGLSDTPFLPDNVVKLFAFGVPGSHSIWMKDMNYALDIIWVSEEGEIVHIEKAVSPDSFPTSFASPTPAWFVIEANSGFVDRNEIMLGDQVVIPTP